MQEHEQEPLAPALLPRIPKNGGNGPPPVTGPVKAHISAGPTSGFLPLTVNFDSRSSTGRIVNRDWDFGDGGTGAGLVVSHTYNSAGPFTAELTVSNDDHDDTASTTIFVQRQPPNAFFSLSPQSGVVPLTVVCDASGSSDPRGSITNYAWDFGDGATANGRVVSHQYLSVGSFQVTLTVTNDGGVSSSVSQSVNVTKPPPPPSPDFTFSPSTGTAPLTVAFDASGSRDSMSIIESYDWNFGDGATANERVPVVSHEFTQAGDFPVTLTVTNQRGISSLIIKNISIRRPSPTAQFGLTFTPESGSSPLQVTFDASKSQSAAPQGRITNYRWAFGDGGTASVDVPILPVPHQYINQSSSPMPFAVLLTVTDDSGESDSTAKAIVVNPHHQPTASFTVSPATGIAPPDLVVHFDASGSQAFDGEQIVSYAWNFGDQTTAVGNNAHADHAYSQPGQYAVTLAVTDNSGATMQQMSPSPVTITPNQPPTVSISANPKSGSAPLLVQFDGHSSSDPDDSISYSWTFGDGATDTTSGPFTSHVYTRPGPYAARLTVIDTGGQSDFKEVTITVT